MIKKLNRVAPQAIIIVVNNLVASLPLILLLFSKQQTRAKFLSMAILILVATVVEKLACYYSAASKERWQRSVCDHLCDLRVFSQGETLRRCLASAWSQSIPQGADLTEAKLTQANMTTTNLAQAYLTKTELNSADLQGATLSGAKLSHANLKNANIKSVF